MNLSFDIKEVLTSDEARRKLLQYGYNELPSAKPKSIFYIAWSVLKSPMFLLLMTCGILYLIFGDLGESLVLLMAVFVVIGITFFQERKSERALQALRNLSSPRAMVVRDGKEIRIPGREVVPDDLVILKEGDRVPADATVLDCLSLSIDESMLTGESVPVRKRIAAQEERSILPGGDSTPFVYSGTMVVQGSGVARVTSTGMHTEIGKIGKSIESISDEKSHVEREMNTIVKVFTIAGLIFCVLLIVLYGFLKDDWKNAVLTGLGLAIGMIPEEFPVVLTIFLAIGAWRMSRQNVLTRNPASIETLGAVSVLCTDKTGTITQNKMTVSELMTGRKKISLDAQPAIEETFHPLIEYAILASQTDPVDPMEKAIRDLSQKYPELTEHIHRDWELVKEYPLSNEMLSMSRVFRSRQNQYLIISAKGSPETILDLCHTEKQEMHRLLLQVNAMAENGLRVIGVACARFDNSRLPDQQHAFDFELLGFLALHDPVRHTIADDVRECYHAGVRVILITGDYPATAQNIGRQIGLKNTGEFITGADLENYSDEELNERMKTVNIFARVVPHQKLRIVKSLIGNGQVAAMTGDGVNDAPALKAAHIGIAMGNKGTDVAREASDLVLLDDNFSSIVQAVRMGRRVYDNMQKAFRFIFATHVPIAALTAIPVFVAIPPILFPMHIALLELITDPACSLVFESEPEEKDIMKRKPMNINQRILGPKEMLLSVLQGLVITAIVLIVHQISFAWHGDAEEARAMAFTTLIVANIGLISTDRSSRIFSLGKNKAFFWLTGLVLVFQSLLLFVPMLQKVFHFGTLHASDLLICLGAGLVSIVWFELVKWLKRVSQPAIS